MAKKKTKQTPKDDLIDSILNDVQEINDQGSKHKHVSGDLFSGDYDSEHDDVDDGAAHLWQEVRDAEPRRHTQSEDLVAPVYKGPNSDDSFEPYKAHEDGDATMPEGFQVSAKHDQEIPNAGAHDDKTININEVAKERQNPYAEVEPPAQASQVDADRTIAVAGFANRQPKPEADVAPKISFGTLRATSSQGGSIYASADATLLQAESLKMAQQRILELEKEVEKYRYENEELASAGEIISQRSEELTARIFALEGEKQEVYDSLQNELLIVKGSLQYKETEVGKARLKIEELETRLKSDFKKIRVRERELENRLELVKAEKSALLRAKDENILDLKRKIDHLESELDNYRRKVLELNKTIDTNQEQFKRTVRALRLALSNLEVKEENVVPLKKAD